MKKNEPKVIGSNKKSPTPKNSTSRYDCNTLSRTRRTNNLFQGNAPIRNDANNALGSSGSNAANKASSGKERKKRPASNCRNNRNGDNAQRIKRQKQGEQQQKA